MTLNIYLLLPDVYTKVSEVNTEDQIRQMLVTVNQLLDLVLREKEAELYYDAENLKNFDAQIREIANVEGFSLEEREALELLTIYENLKDGHHCSKETWQERGCQYILLDLTREKLEKFIPAILTEMTKSILLERGKHLLLNVESAIDSYRHYLPIVKDCPACPDLPPQLAILQWVKQPPALENWLVESRTPRRFNWHPKHGQHGRGQWKGASVLFCDEVMAQRLLESAIADRLDKDLYNYDPVNGRYIVFKDENTPNNTYHGYHLDHSEEVPEEIRNRVAKRVTERL